MPKKGTDKYNFITKEQLEQLYIKANLSREEVAKKLNVPEYVVKRKCQKFGIKKSSDLHVQNIRKACLEKYGVINGGGAPEILEKIKETNRKKFGSDWYLQTDDYKRKTKETLEQYGVTNVFQLKEVKDKIKQTNLERYGVEYNMQNKEIAKKASNGIKENWKNKSENELKIIKQKASEKTKSILWKIDETKRKNGTFNTSKPEQEVKRLLEEKFSDVKYQYKSEKYPFNCDFYIPELDLYIEFQGTWTHGKHPFSESVEDLETLDKWKTESITSEFYKNAIEVWTIKDVEKRKIALQNNINLLEFFTIDEFMNWYNSI